LKPSSFLILPFHGFGHFNGLFGLARELHESHNVVFAANGYFRSHVTSRGFDFRTLSTYPFGVGLEGWIHTDIKKSKNPKWRNLVDRWTDRLYHERFAELSKVLDEVKPVHVLVDVQQATDVIVLKAIDPKLKVSVVSIPPPYLLIPGLPPINSTAMPGDNDDAYKRSLKEINAKVWRQKKKYFGLDDRTMVTRRLRRNRMMNLKDLYPSLVTFAAKDVDVYILTYKEFDFHHPHLDKFRYVGAHPDKEYKEPKADYYRQICEETKRQGKRLVYCSFGTVPSKRDVKGFHERLGKAVEEFNVRLLITTNLNWAAQHTILEYADLFVTHGGINSIHDAIRFKVPMIVYPVSPEFDQLGNSSRVVHSGLGLRGDLDLDTVDDMRAKLKEVFENRSKFKTVDASAYPIDNFIKLLTS
jgi:zeaxanthin glucosyltransferase